MTNNRPTLVFATNNAHKLDEMRGIVGDRFNIVSLADIGCHDDIPEECPTFEGNALAKARWVAERYGYDCFADDTGLEVEALDGAPGVRSARYASQTGHDSVANMRLLLKNMEGTVDRRARFRTAIALVRASRPDRVVEGIVEGRITAQPRGEGGFGYDPVFVPDGYDKTFAELGADVKNHISHRARAGARLVELLDREAAPS